MKCGTDHLRSCAHPISYTPQKLKMRRLPHCSKQEKSLIFAGSRQKQTYHDWIQKLRNSPNIYPMNGLPALRHVIIVFGAINVLLSFPLLTPKRK